MSDNEPLTVPAEVVMYASIALVLLGMFAAPEIWMASDGLPRFLAFSGLSTSMKIRFTDSFDGTVRTVDRSLRILAKEALAAPLLVLAIWRALRGGWGD